ncbi:hypothetical protein KBZ12_01860 [Cyanobium sp. Cruz CV13-4-11]|uniref:hypothetical protein n=1 Tax=unclassified Cyanobium TaxID=2627006 RepID=UPI0020CD15F0|nr:MULTISPECIES: hypothetical protein [unclassified Cyanobium]MCP9899025.1 hypothetical protein [Cyanobium sp. Cruz CV11-17]MCP9918229.1 hypothetical protein [Cyanobium sp. Cruz CV13-4-11]
MGPHASARLSGGAGPAAKAAGHPLQLRYQEGDDHSDVFIASFIDDHLRHHAAALRAPG